MNSDAVTAVRNESFVLLVDGITKSEYVIFADALKAGLKLRRLFPDSVVKIRDAGDLAA
jgi:hypothetical protein